MDPIACKLPKNSLKTIQTCKNKTKSFFAIRLSLNLSLKRRRMGSIKNKESHMERGNHPYKKILVHISQVHI